MAAARKLRSRGEVEVDETWSGIRKRMLEVMSHWAFDAGVGGIVFVGLILLIVETDTGGDEPDWLKNANHILLATYISELVLRFYVGRLRFFCDTLNTVDFFVIGIDLALRVLVASLAAEDMPSMRMLRVLRLARLTRLYRVIVMFPGFYGVLRNLAGALRPVFWSIVLISFTMTLCSIVAVHVVHPLNVQLAQQGYYDQCLRCPRAFETVFQSNLTFLQQYIAGDNWGEVTIPIIDNYPWSAVFFLFVNVVQNLIIMTLVLGLVVEVALGFRQTCIHEQAVARKKERMSATKRFLEMSAEIDAEASGQITLQSVIRAYDEIPAFADAMEAMDIQRSDMKMVFEILDQERRGSILYDEFATQLYRLQSSDSHTLLVFIKQYILDIRSKLLTQAPVADQDIQSNADSIRSESQCLLSARDNQEQIGEMPSKRWVGTPTRSPRGLGSPRCVASIAARPSSASTFASTLGRPSEKSEQAGAVVRVTSGLGDEFVQAITHIADKSEANLKTLEALNDTHRELLKQFQRAAEDYRQSQIERRQVSGQVGQVDDATRSSCPLPMCQCMQGTRGRARIDRPADQHHRIRLVPSPLRARDDSGLTSTCARE